MGQPTKPRVCFITYHQEGHENHLLATPAAGSDYETTTVMVTFQPSGSGQRVCGTVPIINDTLGNEPAELFSVRITGVSDSNIVIGPNNEACVSIIDDDGMY